MRQGASEDERERKRKEREESWCGRLGSNRVSNVSITERLEGTKCHRTLKGHPVT